ncbi:MAG: nicotinate-nucleotide--dimethylbenzimidazole phosphoribosyltransferase [Ruminococcus sp.]|nr:nicotinate-nucleotide--dimethylbenzimidazole phosphoribosyltransferase [Ruminococcus sp.]
MNRIKNISGLDVKAMQKSHEHWNSIAKPLNSLGILERYIMQIAGITGNPNVKLNKRCAVIMCADNGVVCEGVTQTGSDVTAIVANAVAEGTSNISRMAQTFNADVIAVDMGIKSDIKNDKVINRKIAYGTKNIARESAMTLQQAEQAISYGIDIVRDLKNKGTDIIVTGEMGIGNTTTSSAVTSVLLGVSPELVTGKGSGLDEVRFRHKIEVVKKATEINSPDRNNPLEVLSKLGGFDIAGMTGLFLGGAVYHVPVIIDGVISAVSALLAYRINPESRDFMLCSHVSKEPAGKMILDEIGLKPIINAELCLGEGTGGILLLPMLDGALSVYNSAHKFENLPMERYVEF